MCVIIIIIIIIHSFIHSSCCCGDALQKCLGSVVSNRIGLKCQIAD